jgi:hypothetical protein
MRGVFRRRKGPRSESIVANQDAQDLRSRAPNVVDAAAGKSWYTVPGNEADAAVAALCRLRRAASGDAGRMESGDEAVRAVFEQASPEAVVWLASRLISYVDEQGFPEAMGPWLPEE